MRRMLKRRGHDPALTAPRPWSHSLVEASPDARSDAFRDPAHAARPHHEPPSYLLLLDADPETVHLHWRVHWPELRALRADAPADAPLVMRVHDLRYLDTSGANPHATLEWPLQLLSAACFLRVPGGDRLIQAEIGLRLQNRRLLPLVRGQPLRTPKTRIMGTVSHPRDATEAIASSPYPLPSIPPCHELPLATPPGPYRPHPAIRADEGLMGVGEAMFSWRDRGG